MNSKKKFEEHRSQRSQISSQSQGRQQIDLGGSDRLFSFNQSFGINEHNDKMTQQKLSSPLAKSRSLQQQIKSYKTRSSLWEKAKNQIINLNKYLKLSSISLGCSDSAIMKEFFETVDQLLSSKQGKNKEDKNKIAQTKKKEAELFEKLVQSNKKKYELEQMIVNYQHEISKLEDINETLREKSRAQSTERSSKVRQFHQDTLMTIHQKETELSYLQQQNKQLKLQIVRLQESIRTLVMQLQTKQSNFKRISQHSLQIKEQNTKLQKQILRLKGQQQQTLMTFVSLKQELQKIVEENEYIRIQLKKKSQQIKILKKIIESAKDANEEFLSIIKSPQQQVQIKKQQKIEQLLRKEESLKNSLSNSIRFNNQRKKQRRFIKKVQLQPQQSQKLVM